MIKTLIMLAVFIPCILIAQERNTDLDLIALTHVNIIDATGDPVQSNMTIIVQGNRIITIDKSSKVKIPTHAKIINAAGKYLIPGLWDMHIHLLNSISKNPSNENEFSLLIANGVTGIREMWTHIDAMQQIIQLRKQFFEKPGSIPRFGAVGTMVDGSPSIWPGSDTATNETEARVLVRRIKAAGIDFVKTYNKLSREVYFAIADEAKKLQIPIAGHVPYRVLLKEAADAGQQSIEHLTGNRLIVDEDCSVIGVEAKNDLPDSIATNSAAVPMMLQVVELCDEKKAFALYQNLASKKVSQCPTSVLFKRYAIDTAKVLNDPRLKYITAADKKDWAKGTGSRLKSRSALQVDEGKKTYNRVLVQIKSMKNAGVQFLAGTDYDNPYLYPGFSLHDELEIFVEAGFTPMEALQTATINPARFLNTTDSLGTIQKGKIADMVLLDANPLMNIKNTKLINAVFVNGKYLSKETLEKMLLQVEIAANKQ